MLGSGLFPGAAQAEAPATLLGFKPVTVGLGDAIVVPEGYRAGVLIPWGEPIAGDFPAFALDNGADDQAVQVGSHHDGMHFFPIDIKEASPGSSEDGLLVVNHEYVEPRFMHRSMAGGEYDSEGALIVDGVRNADDVRKEANGHGVSVVRIKRQADGAWAVERDPRNRRVTALTPMTFAGPVAGTDFLKTKYSPDGTRTRGTINNCANGFTPWNTYLTCEENWAGYFRNGDETDGEPNLPREQDRYGVPTGEGRYRWELAEGAPDEFVRFDVSVKGASPAEDYRNEANGFGWIVEIDPFDPDSVPVKRTALGRFAHEGIVFAPATEGEPLVAYSGDDSRFEYIYKYVSNAPYAAGAGGSLLDDGTLYVARFNADGSGDWVALKFGENGLTPENGFASQADVLVNTRLAADFVGAIKMDRPEWGAVDPVSGAVYFTLTNNSKRTLAEVDAANPRALNNFGQIIRWTEEGDGHAGTRFTWDLFVLAGNADQSRTFAGAALGADAIFACPDGLDFDSDGRLWIQTDIGEAEQNKGDMEVFGNNQMLCADPRTGEVRRFLTGPIGQEITGIARTPDGTTMFVNVQHPGATTPPDAFAAGTLVSHWPDGSGYPRSATVVITKADGGVIGS
jgi:secreted PhoX family phosphatase